MAHGRNKITIYFHTNYVKRLIEIRLYLILFYFIFVVTGKWKPKLSFKHIKASIKVVKNTTAVRYYYPGQYHTHTYLVSIQYNCIYLTIY